MDEREILTRFKAGTLDRGRAAQLLAGIESSGGGATVTAGSLPGHATSPSALQPAAGAYAPAAPAAPKNGSAPDGGQLPAVEDRFAVVGMAGRYPLAPDLGAFWQNLRDGRDTSSAEPAGRPCRAPLASGQRGHFLAGAAEFDAEFFGLTSHEGRLMDPQERLFLETAWEALEDAGCTGARLDALTGSGGQPRGVGVFVGVSAADYALLAAENWARGGRRCPAAVTGRCPADCPACSG